MGFFDSKKTRTVIVGGALSRIREDSAIKNTTGLVVNTALTTNQNLAEALVLNAATGTIASYRLFNRNAQKNALIGLPTTTFTYSDINKDALSEAIRTQTGNAYPISGDIDDADVTLATLVGEPELVCPHLQYHLQESYNYNLTTNIFTYSTKDYYYDSYADIGDPHTGYTVNGYRTKVITTTTTSAITVYYDVGEAKWKHKDTVTTDVDYVYDPAGETGSSSSAVDNITDYDSIGNPYGLDLSDTGVTFNICIVVGFEYLCDPGVVVTNENDPVTFTLNEARPDEIILTTFQNTIAEQERSNDYWVVYYTSSGREYIWIAAYDDQIDIFLEVEDTPAENPYLVYAPIVAIRNDTLNYSPTYEPEKYRQANACLKVIGLSANAIMDQLTDTVTDPSLTIEDVYVSLFSNLVTIHEDQLAYNYAFFDYMESISINTETQYNDTFTAGTALYNFNRLIVGYTSIFRSSISWAFIKKTTIVGALTDNYEYTIGASGRRHWVTDNGTTSYIIRKKLTSNSYEEIEVSNLMMEYTVYSSSGDVGTFTVSTSSDDQQQLVLPISFELAETFVPRKYLETFYLRSTFIGIFSKSVRETTTKWYEQAWFADLLQIASIIATVYTGYYYLIPAITTTATTLAISTSLASFVVLAEFAIIQYGLKFILTEVFKGTDNPFLRALTTVAIIYATIELGGIESNFSQLFTAVDIVMGAVSLDTQMDIQLASLDLQRSFEEFLNKQQGLEAFSKELKATELLKINGSQALSFYNLFSNPDNYLTEVGVSTLINSPSFLSGLTSTFATVASQPPDPATIFFQSQQLLNS